MIYLSNEPYPQEISVPRSFGVIVPHRNEYLSTADIAADLTTDSDTKVLAASQGVALKAMVDAKADASDVYTKQEVDADLALKADKSNTYTKAQVDGALAEKADVSDIPTKTSDLTNDSGFVTGQEVSQTYETKSDATAKETALQNAINTKQDILTFDNVPTNGSSNPVKSDGIYDALATKQPNISDLQTIRSGAAAGATAVQPAELQTELLQKQDRLISGTNIKTINNTSLLGSGNIVIQGGGSDPEAVKFTPQTLTDAQKEQARTNIGAGTYSKPSDGIPATDLDSSVQASLGKADTALQSESDPVFSASPAHGITLADIAAWDAKYDKPASGIPASDLADTYAGSATAGGAADKALGIPYGSVDSGSTATDIKASVDNFPTTLVAGVCAYIRNDVVASASGWTLNINGTGALPVYASNADASRVTTLFSAATTFLFVYNPTRVSGGCWDMYYGYNANDNTIGYMLRTNGAVPPTASKFYRYRLLFTSDDNQSLIPANTSSSTNATAARAVNQAKINPFAPIYYYSSTSAVEAGVPVGASYAWLQYSGIVLGYSFNRTGSALTMTAKDPVFLKCAPQTDGSAIMDADTPIVQALPSTEDGNIYIYLGIAESATAITLYYWHPIYWYKDGAIRQWTNASESGGGGGTIDNEVTKDSPNAVKSSGIYNALGKYGVISQTQTWTQAADSGYGYTMSNQVWGMIPEYFITMWKLRGGSTATFNETTGYFEYLDLTDISYEEAQVIYSQSIDTPSNEALSRCAARTILPFLESSHFTNATTYAMMQQATFESFFFGDLHNHTTTKTNSVAYLMYAMLYLKNVYGILDFSGVTSDVSVFYATYSLESIQVKGLKVNMSFARSSRLTVASVAYMINNAGTATITITLHATAYARATADADVQAALAAHTNVSLASA